MDNIFKHRSEVTLRAENNINFKVPLNHMHIVGHPPLTKIVTVGIARFRNLAGIRRKHIPFICSISNCPAAVCRSRLS